jgi:subtilisin family serine protease
VEYADHPGPEAHHINLAGRIDLNLSTSFVDAEPFINDLNLHGTYTAALMSSNGLGMASVAPAATLFAQGSGGVGFG